MKKLTSVKLQKIIDLMDLKADTYCILLRFGRKKTDNVTFPIIFKEITAANNLYDELEKLIGITLEKVKEMSILLYKRYSKYHCNK